MEPVKERRWLPAAAVLFALGVALWRLGQVPFYNSEAFYAETAREMLESRDPMTPRFNFDRFLDKPPLYYWLVQPAYRRLGATEQAARLPAALAMAGCVALTVLLGMSLFDAATGCLAGLLLATTMGFYLYSHVVLIEPVLAFWMTASLLSAWNYRRNPAKKAWLWAMYACWALGFLTKGVTALLLPLAVTGSFLYATGGRRALKPLLSAGGWLLFLGLSAPWYLLTALRHRGFLWFCFVHEQLFRFLDLRKIKEPRLTTPAFLGLLVPLLFPWSLFLPQSLSLHLKRWRQGGEPRDASLFLLLWMGIMLGFLTLSKFKLDYYSLPAWPAMMLAVAHYLESSRARGAAGAFLAPMALIVLAGAAALPLAPRAVAALGNLPDPWFLEGVRQASTVVLCGSLAAAAFAVSGRRLAAVFCLAAMMPPVMGLAQRGMLLMSPYLSNKELALAARSCLERLSGEGILVHGEAREDICVGSCVFYSRRKVWLLAQPDQRLFPMGRDFFLTPQQLASWWDKSRPVLMVEESGRIPKVLEDKPAHILARSGGKILISNRSVCAPGENTLVSLD